MRAHGVGKVMNHRGLNQCFIVPSQSISVEVA